MELLNIILTQIASPPILFFAPGMFATLAGSNLKIPGDIGAAMMLFLLCAMGLKGGIGIAETGVGAISTSALAAIVLGVGIVLYRFSGFARKRPRQALKHLPSPLDNVYGYLLVQSSLSLTYRNNIYLINRDIIDCPGFTGEQEFRVVLDPEVL